MPENVTDSTEPNETQNQSDSQPTEPPSGTPSEEYRFTSGPYSGLTATEVANRATAAEQQTQQVIQQVQNYVSQQQYQQQQQAAQPTQTLDPDLWVTDPARAQQLFQQQVTAQTQQQLSAAAQPMIAAQAASAKAMSQNTPANAEVWKKYGREIETMAARVPLQNQINPEIWNGLVKLVKAEHIDELAQEKALGIAANLPMTEGGRVSGHEPLSNPQSNAIRKIRESDWGKDHLDYLSDRQLMDQVSKMGNTLDEYANMVANTKVITHPKKPNEWVNQNLVRDV